MDNSASIVNRRHNDYVTIVHLSDLHFPPPNEQPRSKLNPGYPEFDFLIDDICKQKPDLICVTGDIADNPYSALIKKAWTLPKFIDELIKEKSRFEEWSNSLEKTFEEARIFLEKLCSKNELIPSTALHVVPGNHDFRIQGISKSPRWWFGKTESELRLIAPELFKNSFENYFRNLRIVFEAPDNHSDPIRVAIVGFDSNSHEDIVGNFATGCITSDQLQAFKFFDETVTNTKNVSNCPEFRICQVHHHPLPVVPGERTPGSVHDSLTNEVMAILQGEQTTLFKNAGTFLLCALHFDVNLILHGHQHHSWYSSIRYPGFDNWRRLLVAASGSIGEITEGWCKYNVIHLHRNGNIDIEERGCSINPPLYQSTGRFDLYSDDELRLFQYANLSRSLEKVQVPVMPDMSYGMATADQITRVHEIHIDGSASVSVTLSNIRGNQPNVTRLPISFSMSKGGYCYPSPPRVTIISDPDNHYTASCEPFQNAESQNIRWDVVFNTQLDKQSPVSLKIDYEIFNAFDFIEEYFRARSPSTPIVEGVACSSCTIYSKRIIQSVSFPSEWKPPRKPRLKVIDNESSRDQNEQRYQEHSLAYIENKGVLSICIDQPLPGYNYCLLWDLTDEKTFNKMVYSPSSFKRFNDIQGLIPNKKLALEIINPLLKALFDKYSHTDNGNLPILGKNSELELQLAHLERLEKPKRIKAVLKSIGYYSTNAEKLSSGVELEAGVGLSGLAYSSGQTKCWSKLKDYSGYYHKDKQIDHESLACIPLSIPLGKKRKSEALSDSIGHHSPVYAILCAGSFSKYGGVNFEAEGFKGFEEYVAKELNNSLYGILVDFLVNQSID